MWLGALESSSHTFSWLLGIIYMTLFLYFCTCILRRKYLCAWILHTSWTFVCAFEGVVHVHKFQNIQNMPSVSPPVPTWTRRILSIHPFRFARAFRRACEPIIQLPDIIDNRRCRLLLSIWIFSRFQFTQIKSVMTTSGEQLSRSATKLVKTLTTTIKYLWLLYYTQVHPLQ